jgi:hypothetical protein
MLKAATERQIDTAWRTRGVCQTVDPETFFPAPTDPPDAAIALCGTCPVQGACLAWALDAGDCHGVWGGTTARERRAMVVAWRTPEQPEEHAYAESAAGAALAALKRPGDTTPHLPTGRRGPSGVPREALCGEAKSVFIPLQRSVPLEALVG